MDLKVLQAMADDELRKHGLYDWTFRLADTKRRLGVCNYRAKRIEIAAFYAVNNPDTAVRDTLLHEIAHALAGPAARHGPAWKAIAMRLGAIPRACDNSAETVVAPGDWQATCPACRKTVHLYKRPRSLSGYRCKCSARSPLVFKFVGDPAREPAVPMTFAEAASWQATCVGCGTVHRRTRRPKAGVWQCRCARGSELTWRFVRPQTAADEPPRPI